MNSFLGNLLLLLATGIILPACSWNHHGLGVNTQHYQSKSGQWFIINSHGLHFNTLQKGLTINLGGSQQTYFYPIQNPPACPAIHSTRFLQQVIEASQGQLIAENKDIKWHHLEKPIAVSGSNQGLTLHATPTGIGVKLGANRHAILKLPHDLNTIVYINYRAGFPDQTTFYYREVNK